MNKLKSQSGSTAILMTVLILGAVLTSVLTTSEIMRVNLIIDRDQLNSTKAYFAAEAGAETVMYEFRNDSNAVDEWECDGEYIITDPDYTADAYCDAAPADPMYDEFTNGTEYNIYQEYTASPLHATTTVTGFFNNIERKVKLIF